MEEEKKENKGLTPIDNGYVYDKFRWTQKAKEVSICIPLLKTIKPKDLKIIFKPEHLYVKIKDDEPIFDGKLFSKIKCEDSTWLIEDSDDNNELVIELEKKKFDEWWSCVLIGEEELDMSLIRPPNAYIGDLDQETRYTIDKMLYEQEIKEKSGFYDRK